MMIRLGMFQAGMTAKGISCTAMVHVGLCISRLGNRSSWHDCEGQFLHSDGPFWSLYFPPGQPEQDLEFELPPHDDPARYVPGWHDCEGHFLHCDGPFWSLYFPPGQPEQYLEFELPPHDPA
eukprot:UC4_evm1s720